MAEWEQYNKLHTKELEKEQKEYAKRQAYIKAHKCPVCKQDFGEEIKTATIQVGNSTCHITACPDCTAKYQIEIEKSQQPTKPRDPYPASHYTIGLAGGMHYGYEALGEIEILIDGKPEFSANGGYKSKDLKGFMRQYCKPGEGKIRLVKVR